MSPGCGLAPGPDGHPASTDVGLKMLIGRAANADRYETWLANPIPTPTPTQDSHQPFVAAAPLSAYGRGATAFTGVMDSTEVPFKLAKIAGASWVLDSVAAPP
jgi:alkaline phosphatase